MVPYITIKKNNGQVFLPSDLAGYTHTMHAEQNVSWKAQSVERFTVEREVVGLFLLFPRAGPILCRVYSWEMKALPGHCPLKRLQLFVARMTT